MKQVKILSIATIFLFVSINCSSVKPRETQETEMLSLLNKVAPLAQQLDGINKAVNEFQEKERNSNNSPESKAEIAKLKESAKLKIENRKNIQTEMSAYQGQLLILKQDYIINFGEIAYNEFIKKSGYYWGLGIYW